MVMFSFLLTGKAFFPEGLKESFPKGPKDSPGGCLWHGLAWEMSNSFQRYELIFEKTKKLLVFF